MEQLIARIGLPLLSKELIEQSSRRRTWIIRASFLGLLFLVFLATAAAMWDGNVRSMLGGGARLFDTLATFQWWGVYVLVPLTCFGLITSEKERDSLQLLFLTRLGPWTILIEKLLSRLVPMSLFLVASLPLLAVSYSYGGVSPEMLSNAVLCLVSSGFFLACVALMFSCYSHLSTQAFFGTLAFSVLTMLVPVVVYVAVHETFGPGTISSYLPFIQNEDLLPGMFFGPAIMWTNQLNSFETCFYWNLPQIAVGLCCLGFARIFLTRRAFVSKPNSSRRARVLIDRAAGAVLGKSTEIPELKNPVTWIERRQGLSGRPAYLVGKFFVLGGLLVLGAFIGAVNDWLEVYACVVHGIIWVVAPVSVCGKAAGLFGTERSRQTLDVLLTTPLTTKSIVRQKMGGTWPQVVFLLALFLLLAIINMFGAFEHSHRTQPIGLAIVATMVTAITLLSMFAWMSVAISLRTKTASRATIYSVVAFAAWCIGPYMFLVPCLMFASGPQFFNDEAFVACGFPLVTPAFFPIMCVSAFASYQPLEEWFMLSLCVNTVTYLGLALLFRWFCLSRASKALNRLDEGGS